MQKTIAICFAKTPGLTPAKTRLAKNLGTKKSESLYHLMVNRCKELMEQLNDIHSIVAVNEEEGLDHSTWKNQQTYLQHPGQLGDKLAHAETHFLKSYQQILFWGTDSPSLSISDFDLARQNLNASPQTIIAAHDGGFILYGSRRPIGEDCWKAVPYSCANTLTELMKHTSPETHLFTTRHDLDTVEDIPLVIGEMQAIPSQGMAWEELLKFLKSL